MIEVNRRTEKAYLHTRNLEKKIVFLNQKTQFYICNIST